MEYFRRVTKTQTGKNTYKLIQTVSLSLISDLNPIHTVTIKIGNGK